MQYPALDDLLAFTDAMDKRLEVLSKSSFALIGLSMQLITTMAICQTLAVNAWPVTWDLSQWTLE